MLLCQPQKPHLTRTHLISGGPLGISACGGAGLSRGGPSLTPTSTQLGEEEVSRYFLIVGQDQDL